MKYIFLIGFLLYILKLSAQINPCEVTYVYKASDSTQLISFKNRNQGLSIVSYNWNFGDGSLSDLPNPEHVYDEPGTYYVCLTIVTSQGCLSTFCDSIIIQGITHDTTSSSFISGYINAGTNRLPQGVVLLINKTFNYHIVKYSDVDSGEYEFEHVLPGDYLIYAIPYFNININYFPSYLPTYVGNSIHWESATTVHHNSNNQNINLDLICNTDIMYGNDSLSGNISLCDSSNYESDIFDHNWFGNIQTINHQNAINQPVILYNKNGKPLRYSLTDESGNYLFTNLPDSSYYVSPQKPGFSSSPAFIEFGNSTNQAISNSFILGNEVFTIGIFNPVWNDLSDEFVVFPNPFSNLIYLNVNHKTSQDYIVRLYDPAGKELLLNKISLSSGFNNYYFHFDNIINNGIYYLIINDKNNKPLKTVQLIRNEY
jgi:PKD repeat protein